MINTIRSEWIKFRSVRSTVVLLLVGGVLTILFAALLINDVKDDSGIVRLTDISAGVQISAFLFGALGVQVIGQEYRFSTIRPTFSATPKRWRVLTAKVIVVSAAVAVVSLVMLVVCIALGNLFLDNFRLDGTDQRTIWTTALFAAGWAALGFGVGAILRQPIAGIIVLLVEGFVIESILIGIFPSTGPWMPFQNGLQMTVRQRATGEHDEYLLRSFVGGGVYFFVVVAVVLAIGFFLAQKRDA